MTEPSVGKTHAIQVHDKSERKKCHCVCRCKNIKEDELYLHLELRVSCYVRVLRASLLLLSRIRASLSLSHLVSHSVVLLPQLMRQAQSLAGG